MQCSYDAERIEKKKKKKLSRSMGWNYMLRKYPRRAPLGRIIFGALWVYSVSLHQDKTKIVSGCAMSEERAFFPRCSILATLKAVFFALA